MKPLFWNICFSYFCPFPWFLSRASIFRCSDSGLVIRQILSEHGKSLDEKSFNNQLQKLNLKTDSKVPLYLKLACDYARFVILWCVTNIPSLQEWILIRECSFPLTFQVIFGVVVFFLKVCTHIIIKIVAYFFLYFRILSSYTEIFNLSCRKKCRKVAFRSFQDTKFYILKSNWLIAIVAWKKNYTFTYWQQQTGKVHHYIYRKPTNTDRYLNFRFFMSCLLREIWFNPIFLPFY